MLKMICEQCANELGKRKEWNDSILGNWNDTCMECGKSSGTSEVDVPRKKNRYQMINNMKEKKGPQWISQKTGMKNLLKNL